MIITISRQAATNGGLLGRLVAERLGLRVYDREVVDEVARRMQVRPAYHSPVRRSVAWVDAIAALGLASARG